MNPVGTCEAPGDSEELLDHIAALLEERDVGTFVVGSDATAVLQGEDVILHSASGAETLECPPELEVLPPRADRMPDVAQSYGGQFWFDFKGMRNRPLFSMNGNNGQNVLIDMEKRINQAEQKIKHY